MNLTEIAREILQAAREAGADAYELWRAARNPDYLLAGPTEAVAYVAHLIDGCTEFDIARLDRVLFEG